MANEIPVRAYATFRLIGDSLDRDEMKERTGLKTASPRSIPNVWTFSSKQELEPSALEDHLVFLLNRLTPAREELSLLIRERSLRADVWCFWDTATTDSSGPQISGDTLRRLADLPVEEVIFQIFDSSDEE